MRPFSLHPDLGSAHQSFAKCLRAAYRTHAAALVRGEVKHRWTARRHARRKATATCPDSVTPEVSRSLIWPAGAAGLAQAPIASVRDLWQCDGRCGKKLRLTPSPAE